MNKNYVFSTRLEFLSYRNYCCVITVYYRTPDIDSRYWLLVFIVFSNLLAILRLPVLMGEVITVYARTPDIGGGYWFLSNLVIYQLYYDYQP